MHIVVLRGMGCICKPRIFIVIEFGISFILQPIAIGTRFGKDLWAA